MATVRTVFSPRCCATSSTSRLPLLSVSSAFRMAGRWPSNWTSTTAPITWVTRPTCDPFPFVIVILVLARRLHRLGARNDLDQFLGDLRLALTVVAQRQPVDHVAGVA